MCHFIAFDLSFSIFLVNECSRNMFEDDMREKLVKELLRCVISECLIYLFQIF